MRKKRNCLGMVSWRICTPHKCGICGKEAKSNLFANTYFRRYNHDLCDECLLKWTNGELYID